MTKQTHKFFASVCASVALSYISSQAYAIEEVDMGVFTGSSIASEGHYAPKKSWADSLENSGGFGWVHTGSSFAKLQIGSTADIVNGVVYDVTFKMTAEGVPGASSLDNPAFTIWTSGNNEFDVNTVSDIGLTWLRANGCPA